MIPSMLPFLSSTPRISLPQIRRPVWHLIHRLISYLSISFRINCLRLLTVCRKTRCIRQLIPSCTPQSCRVLSWVCTRSRNGTEGLCGHQLIRVWTHIRYLGSYLGSHWLSILQFSVIIVCTLPQSPATLRCRQRDFTWYRLRFAGRTTCTTTCGCRRLNEIGQQRHVWGVSTRPESKQVGVNLRNETVTVYLNEWLNHDHREMTAKVLTRRVLDPRDRYIRRVLKNAFNLK